MIQLFNKPRIQLYLTDKCKLKCKHCFLGTSDSLFTNLSLKEAKEILKFFYEKGARVLTLTGGESSCHPLLPPLVEFANRIGYKKVDIITNGQKKKILNQINPNMVNHITVSLDGATARTNDYLRGKGTFKKTINFLKVALEKKFNTYLVYAVHKKNVSEIKKVILLADRLGVKRLSFNHIYPMGNARFNKNLCLSPLEWIKIRKKLEKVKGLKQLTLRFPIRFVTKKECQKLIKKRYECPLNKPIETLIMSDKKVFYCCLLTDTNLNTAYYKNKKLVLNKTFNEMDIYQRYKHFSCPAQVFINHQLDKFDLKETLPICIYWKEILEVRPQSK